MKKLLIMTLTLGSLSIFGQNLLDSFSSAHKEYSSSQVVRSNIENIEMLNNVTCKTGKVGNVIKPYAPTEINYKTKCLKNNKVVLKVKIKSIFTTNQDGTIGFKLKKVTINY